MTTAEYSEGLGLASMANVLTVARLLASPLFIVMITETGPDWRTFGVGFVLAITDLIDGWLARKRGSTRSGAFLDPLADKVFVLGSMYALVANGAFSWIPVTIIAARELAMSLYRSVVARQGISIPAVRLAKWKTVIQTWAIGFALIPEVAHNAHWIATTTLWLAVALTLWTGAVYWRSARNHPAVGGAPSR